MWFKTKRIWKGNHIFSLKTNGESKFENNRKLKRKSAQMFPNIAKQRFVGFKPVSHR